LVGAGDADPQIFDRFRFSALASRAPFIRPAPIYAGVERTSVREANVCQLPHPRNLESLRPAASRKIASLFQLKTNPFFSMAPRPQARAGRTFRKSKNQSQFQIRNSKDRSKQWISNAEHQGAGRDSILAFARSANKKSRNEAISHPAIPRQSATRRSPKSSEKANFQYSRQRSRRTQPWHPAGRWHRPSVSRRPSRRPIHRRPQVSNLPHLCLDPLPASAYNSRWDKGTSS